MAKDVLQKLDDMYGKANDSEKAIIDFLKVWIAEDESAAEKVTADNKTPKGAYNAMRDYARKKNAQGLHGKEAWVQVMKYYGEDETSADQKLEHGLMFACIRAEMEAGGFGWKETWTTRSGRRRISFAFFRNTAKGSSPFSGNQIRKRLRI